AEAHRLDHRAEVAFADLGNLRVRDRVDHRTSGLGGRSVGGADEDGAVVFDADLRARVLLDLVDHLALGSDDLTDLVDGDVHGDDPRCGRVHLGGWDDGFGADVEDDHAGRTGLRECRGQHRGGQAAEHGVELDGSDELDGAGGAISAGAAVASAMASRMTMRASRACLSAAVSTEAGSPSSLVSSWMAVTNSRVPATLKSMSPKASSAPRMSVRAA